MKLLLTFFTSILLPASLFAFCTPSFTTSIDGQGDTICMGAAVVFTNNSTMNGTITATQWDFGDGTGLVFTENANHAYIQAGNYTVSYTITSSGCTAQTFQKTIHVIDMPNYLSWGTDATCSGDCDGTANIDIQISPPVTYHFMWDDPDMQTTATATGLCAGVYSATISDDYGCTLVASGINVNEPDPIVVFAGADITICPASMWPISDAAIISGGVGPFAYNWSPGTSAGMNPDNILNPILTANANSFTTFTLKVTDSDGCKGADSLVVTKQLAKIAGTVLNENTGGPITQGWVYLMEVGDPNEQWVCLNTVPISANGDYTFNNVPLVDVIVLAEPTGVPAEAMPTYWGDTVSWADADVISPACGTHYLNTDINCIVPPQQTGTCDFHGTVYLVSTGKTQSEDPIPLIDVVVKKTPPGNAIAFTKTDPPGATKGEFNFHFMPALTDTEYTFVVNIEGLSMHNNYSIDVDPNHVLWDSLNFYVDTTAGTGGIFTYNPLGIKPVKAAYKQMSVSPNPFDDRVEMNFPNTEKGKFSIRLFDVMGKIIIDLDDLNGNTYTLKTDMLEQGIYIAEIQTENDVFRERVMKK